MVRTRPRPQRRHLGAKTVIAQMVTALRNYPIALDSLLSSERQTRVCAAAE
jgi:hypothetical protein